MTDTANKTAAALAAIVAGVALVLFLTRSEPAPEPEVPGGQPPAPEVQTPPTPPLQAVVPPPAENVPEEHMLVMPDGSRVPPLNGVEVAPELLWGNHPWSPIIGKETVNGYEWYVHEDGSKTTTFMVWRDDLGRMDATAICAHPTTPISVEGGGKKQ